MQLSQLRISEKQIEEWTDNPVTTALKILVEQRIKAIDNTPVSDALFRGNPQTTQENLVVMSTMTEDFLDMVNWLEGLWDELLEEDSE